MKQPSNLPPGTTVKDIEDWQQQVEQEHTLGPWRVVRIDTHAFNIRAGEDSVAMVYANLGSPVLMDRDGEGEANAKLIGSSPDLLEALVKLSNEVLGSLPLVEPELRREIGNTNYTVLMQRAQEARELVAKVKGKQ